jgi:hypothetical protein
MKRGLQGKLVIQGVAPEPFRSFVPRPLPPDPRIEFCPELLDLMEKANLALGRLDGLARLLPDLQLFLYFYVRKEAVLSSQMGRVAHLFFYCGVGNGTASGQHCPSGLEVIRTGSISH